MPPRDITGQREEAMIRAITRERQIVHIAREAEPVPRRKFLQFIQHWPNHVKCKHLTDRAADGSAALMRKKPCKQRCHISGTQHPIDEEVPDSVLRDRGVEVANIQLRDVARRLMRTRVCQMRSMCLPGLQVMRHGYSIQQHCKAPMDREKQRHRNMNRSLFATRDAGAFTVIVRPRRKAFQLRQRQSQYFASQPFSAFKTVQRTLIGKIRTLH